MRHRPPLGTPLLLLTLLACEQETSLDELTCGIDVRFDGDLDTALTPDSSVACIVPFAHDAGFDIEYAPLDHPVERFNLVVDAVTPGMTGTGFPATIRVGDASGTTWTSDACTASISEHDLEKPVEFGDQYRVRGTGECAAPLTDEAAGSLTLSPFEFVATITWGG